MRAPKILAAVLLFASACTFRPDYSSYEKCDATTPCSDPTKSCWVEEGICITLCGEKGACGAEDAGVEDAGTDDAGAEDAGELDAGEMDAGQDAGVEDAGETDAGARDPGIALEPTLPAAVELTPYSHALEVDGGVAPFTFMLTGALPPDLTFDAGTFEGTPNAPGSATFTVFVEDSDTPPSTDQRQYTLDVEALLRIASPATLPNADVGQPYNEPLFVTGGTDAGVTWTLTSGSLPPNFMLDGGVVTTGTKNVNSGGSFTLQAVDQGPAKQTRSRTFTIGAVALGVTVHVLTRELPSGRVGAPYSYTLKSGGGSGAHTWTLMGTLPQGLILNGATIQGTPTANAKPGTTFTLVVRDSLNISASDQFTLTIH